MPASTPNPQAEKTLNNNICSRPTCTRKARAEAVKYFHGLCDRHARAAGLINSYVDVDDARDELRRLHSGGWLNSHIMKSTGLAYSTIVKIKTGKTSRTRKKVLDALQELPTESPYLRPAWPCHRRIQSLRGAGHTMEEIAGALGIPISGVERLQRGRRDWVEADLDRKIRAFFDKHKFDQPRPLSAALELERLPLPMQWKNIDDPFEDWPKAPTDKRADGSGQHGATATFYDNFDTIRSHVGNQHKLMQLLKINIRTCTAWQEHTAEKVTTNQYNRVAYHAKRIRTQQPQATQKEAA